MTAPIPTTSGGAPQLGALIGDFPPSDGRRFADLALRAVALYIAITGAIAFIKLTSCVAYFSPQAPLSQVSLTI